MYWKSKYYMNWLRLDRKYKHILECHVCNFKRLKRTKKKTKYNKIVWQSKVEVVAAWQCTHTKALKPEIKKKKKYNINSKKIENNRNMLKEQKEAYCFLIMNYALVCSCCCCFSIQLFQKIIIIWSERDEAKKHAGTLTSQYRTKAKRYTAYNKQDVVLYSSFYNIVIYYDFWCVVFVNRFDSVSLSTNCFFSHNFTSPSLLTRTVTFIFFLCSVVVRLIFHTS